MVEARHDRSASACRAARGRRYLGPVHRCWRRRRPRRQNPGAAPAIIEYSADPHRLSGRRPPRHQNPIQGRDQSRTGASADYLATATASKTALVGISGRVHRQPARDSAVLDRRLLARTVPDRLPGRLRRSPASNSTRTVRKPDDMRGLSPLRPSTTWCRRPDQAGLLGLQGGPFSSYPIYTVLSAPDRRRLRARTPTSPGSRSSSRSASFNQYDVGRPGRRRAHDAQRFAKGGWLPRRRTLPEIASNSPEKPFLSNPTTCVGPLRVTFHSHRLRPAVRHAETVPGRRRPAATSSASIPRCRVAPDHRSADSASGPRHRPQGPQTGEPRRSLRLPDQGRHRHLPRGLLDQPDAADGKISCSDAQAAVRDDRRSRSARSSRRSGPSRSLSSALPGAAARVRSISATRCPATATGSSSPPTASAPTSSSPARSRPDPKPVS